MDDLPQPLMLDILSRLNDSHDVARVRQASKTLNTQAYELRSINLLCSFARYRKSRSPETKALITPFKEIFKNLVRNSRNNIIERVSIGVEKPLRERMYDELELEDEFDDLYLTDASFVNEWLIGVCGRLRSLSISDFWVQACWRKSEVLALISSCCHSLVELELKSSWLSMNGLNPMPALTSLTLEFIRLDDEDLNKFSDCFPSLQVLNLIGVGGFKYPRIHLLHLKSCQWTVSNAPASLTIIAPSLVKLKLVCVRPKSLVLETPLLSDFHLSIETVRSFEAKEFLDLRTLQLESTQLSRLIGTFPFGKTVEILSLDSQVEPVKFTSFKLKTGLNLETLVDVFPNVSSLTLSPQAWAEIKTSFQLGCFKGRMGANRLKEIIARVVVRDVDDTMSFICSLLNEYNLSDIGLLIHGEVHPSISSNLIASCTAYRPKVRWRWGMWKEGMKDVWLSSGIW